MSEPSMTATDEGGRQSLPVADAKTVRDYVLTLIRQRRGQLGLVILWFCLATLCGLATPALLGGLVDKLAKGTPVNLLLIVGAIALFLVAQAIFTRTARLAAARAGENTLSDLRSEFVDRVLNVPVSIVERAGTGDLVSRMSRDVNALSTAVRTGAPTILITSISILLTVVATAIVSPLALVFVLVVVPMFTLATRWYLRRSRAAYLRQSASYADLTDVLAETVSGAKTVEALGRQDQRQRLTDGNIARTYSAERGTLRLRTVWFPFLDVGYYLPVITALLLGGLAYIHGWMSLGAVVTSVLYAQALIDPMDELITWLDELQIAGASLARIIGVKQASEAPAPSGAKPAGSTLVAHDVRFAFRAGHDVIRGVDLELAPGERLAIVGPSGAGKSTLGRILVGLNQPDAGQVTCGGVGLAELSLADRRREVALVTQEHHVFMGSMRDNVTLARPDATDDEVLSALDAVDAGWVRELADGLDTQVGSGGLVLSPGQVQQLALSRLVLADPHTVILDEATSALDPQAARHLEQSLAAVLSGRTVVAIAHRLHTAYDADRVAVMEGGLIVELGSHDELMARNGRYAALWDAWHGRTTDEVVTESKPAIAVHLPTGRKPAAAPSRAKSDPHP